MTRKQALTTLAVISIVSIACCFFLLPPIFPAVPPPEFHKIKAGMPIKDAKAILGANPHVVVDEKKKNEDGVEIEPAIAWMHWNVHNGSIQVGVNRNDRIEMVVFQASRSSVVEELQDLWRLRRFFH